MWPGSLGTMARPWPYPLVTIQSGAGGRWRNGSPTASRAGYATVAVASSSLFVALATNFNATMAAVVTAALVAGCVLLGAGDHPRLRREGRRAGGRRRPGRAVDGGLGGRCYLR